MEGRLIFLCSLLGALTENTGWHMESENRKLFFVPPQSSRVRLKGFFWAIQMKTHAMNHGIWIRPALIVQLPTSFSVPVLLLRLLRNFFAQGTKKKDMQCSCRYWELLAEPFSRLYHISLCLSIVMLEYVQLFNLCEARKIFFICRDENEKVPTLSLEHLIYFRSGFTRQFQLGDVVSLSLCDEKPEFCVLQREGSISLYFVLIRHTQDYFSAQQLTNHVIASSW